MLMMKFAGFTKRGRDSRFRRPNLRRPFYNVCPPRASEKRGPAAQKRNKYENFTKRPRASLRKRLVRTISAPVGVGTMLMFWRLLL